MKLLVRDDITLIAACQSGKSVASYPQILGCHSRIHRAQDDVVKQNSSANNDGMSYTATASRHHDDMMLDMRTTIDIEESALATARAYASSERCSLGQAVSRLIMEAEQPFEAPEGFPVFPDVPGHVITNELIAKYRDGDDDDDE